VPLLREQGLRWPVVLPVEVVAHPLAEAAPGVLVVAAGEVVVQVVLPGERAN